MLYSIIPPKLKSEKTLQRSLCAVVRGYQVQQTTCDSRKGSVDCPLQGMLQCIGCDLLVSNPPPVSAHT